MGLIRIQPHDPLIVRDGRPFGAASISSNRMYSLPWPYPSLVAGSFRTWLGKQLWKNADSIDDVFNEKNVERLKNIRLVGPFLLINRQYYVAAPTDVSWNKLNTMINSRIVPKVLRPKPMNSDEGNDLFTDALWPINIEEDFKPEKKPLFWNWELTKKWILNDGIELLNNFSDFNTNDFFHGFERDVRTHIQMNPLTNTNSEEGSLFSTTGLDFAIDALHAEIVSGFEFNPSIDSKILRDVQDGYHPIGGERRLSYWQIEANEHRTVLPFDPVDVQNHLVNSKGIRMLLLTPAQFVGGWLPSWIDGETLEGTPPGLSRQELLIKLRWAVIERWQPLSGWSLEKNNRGPKAITRLVPSGSVYFFEVIDGDPTLLRHLWLQPVTDDEQFNKDGFGIAIWGRWDLINNFK